MGTVPIAGADKPWLYSFAVEGPTNCKIEIPTNLRTAQKLSVTLHFCELDPAVKSRVFDIQLNGQTVAKQFDLVREARGAFKAVTKSFTVATGPFLTVELIPAPGTAAPPLINGLLIEEFK